MEKQITWQENYKRVIDRICPGDEPKSEPYFKALLLRVGLYSEDNAESIIKFIEENDIPPLIGVHEDMPVTRKYDMLIDIVCALPDDED